MWLAFKDEQQDGDDEIAMNKFTVEAILEGCETLTEAKYLMQHLFDLCLQKAAIAAKVEAEFKESNARIEQLEQQNEIVVIAENLAMEGGDEDGEENSGRKSQTSSVSPTVIEESLQNVKIRRHTATQEELLYPSEVVEQSEETTKKKKISNSIAVQPSTSAPNFQRNSKQRSTVGGRLGNCNGGGFRQQQNRKGGKETLSRLASVQEDCCFASTSNQQPTTSLSATYPPTRSKSTLNSTSMTNKKLTSNNSTKSVFARISPSWLNDTCAELIMKNNRRHSRIAPVKDGMRGSVVSRTHTLEGHAKGVLSVDVSNENLMITGSKDRTAKLWDIEAGKEIRTLGVHPNNVHLVKFVPFSNLVFTFSMFEGRAWDYRSPDCICVKVINSSGQVNDGSSIDVTSVMPRQNSIPFLESVITAADVDPTGQMLFTSFSAFVRVWNLREWKPLGRLNAASHSPKSEVSCLKTTMTSEGSILAYTGSRDHYVKEYEVGTGVGIIESKSEFTPPHYDNVTAVLPLNGYLYTASKDLNIMKFSLTDGKREHLELRAHQQYIQSLVSLGNQKGKEHLVSACKDGTVRFWDVSNKMRLVEEYSKAHSDSINDMSTKNNMLFTASSDSTVGFWKLN
ncbi:unnamed protein product [Caenorhabditis angaria]|uniref:KIF21A/B second helical domain-containing protein n=1 Tax=Caenorhabditis angaria TaxID=860376 RepID=A0A9P1IP87_9PELO|nr:unnamed protein product [Caenorhabditis angaria]